jgi:hypothetical protein
MAENERLLIDKEIKNSINEYIDTPGLNGKYDLEKVVCKNQDAKSYVAGRHDAAKEIIQFMEERFSSHIIHTELYQWIKSKYGVK